MNEYPDRTGREAEGAPASGGFKVNIPNSVPVDEGREPPRQKQGRSAPRADASYSREFASEAEQKAEQKAHRKRNRLKARKNKRIFAVVWICMVLLLAFTLASYLIGGANDFFAVGRYEGTTEITIPEDLAKEKNPGAVLAEILFQHGAIKKPEFFSLYSKVTVDDEEWEYFKPGVYQLNTNMDYEDILNTLQGGNETLEVVTVTFPEGVTALQAAALLEENEVCTKEDFLTALNGDFSNYKEIGQLTNTLGRYYKLEGYLFPDTYDFYKGEELESVVGKMLNNFHEKMSDATLALVSQSGYTMDQIVTLASIIQAEAADPADMFYVSAVLHNRLDFGAEHDIFFLECDSTIYYPYREAEDVPTVGALSYGAYNTYSVGGLPAGAICNPGMDAIMAALKPSPSGENYLYFCHSEDGRAYYAATSWEHEENLREAGLLDDD